MTIDLTMIGKDSNFDTEEASNEEKAKRVISFIDAVENLSLVKKRKFRQCRATICCRWFK